MCDRHLVIPFSLEISQWCWVQVMTNFRNLSKTTFTALRHCFECSLRSLWQNAWTKTPCAARISFFWNWPSIDPYSQDVQSIHQSQPTTLNLNQSQPLCYFSRAVWQEQLCFKIQVSLDHLRAQLVTWTKAESQRSGGFKRYGSRGMIFSMVGRINVEGESGHHLSLPRSHRHNTRLL